jgi:hypothetical protein
MLTPRAQLDERPAGRRVLCLAIAMLSLPRLALAQSSSATSVDAARGTISGSTRYVGLGGAFVAIADDTEGVPSNPASVAVRLPYSLYDWDYGLGADFAIGTWLPKNDIYNQPGEQGAKKSTSLVGSFAGILYYRHLGFGIAAEGRRNEASRSDMAQGVGTNLAGNFGTVHAAAAYGFLDGQLQLGLGPRFVGVGFASSGAFTAGVGYETGVIVKPTGQQYRVGLAWKSPIEAKIFAEGAESASRAHLPWEAALGFAYQFGNRPLNPSFESTNDRVRRNAQGRTPTDEDYKTALKELYDEYQTRQRWYLLVSSELSLIEGGGRVGLSEQAAKSRPIISPRLGVESEVVPHWLRLRAGTYYEPARTADSHSRIHATGGLDVKLFRFGLFGLLEPFDYWQLSLAVDGARSYLNTSFSLGFWY